MEREIDAPQGAIDRLNDMRITYERERGTIDVSCPSLGLFTPDILSQLSKLGTASGWWVQERVAGDEEPGLIIKFSPNPHPGSDRRILRVHNCLYHACPRIVVPAIIKRGLFRMPVRQVGSYMNSGQFQVIYAADNPETAIFVLTRKGYAEENIAIFRIYTYRLPESVKFFQDPQFDHSYFTNSVIPASALELVSNPS